MSAKSQAYDRVIVKNTFVEIASDVGALDLLKPRPSSQPSSARMHTEAPYPETMAENRARAFMEQGSQQDPASIEGRQNAGEPEPLLAHLGEAPSCFFTAGIADEDDLLTGDDIPGQVHTPPPAPLNVELRLPCRVRRRANSRQAEDLARDARPELARERIPRLLWNQDFGEVDLGQTQKEFRPPLDQTKFLFYGNRFCRNRDHRRVLPRTSVYAGLEYNKCFGVNEGRRDANSGFSLAWFPECLCGDVEIPLNPSFVFQDSVCCGCAEKHHRICLPCAKPNGRCSAARQNKECAYCNDCEVDQFGVVTNTRTGLVEATPAAALARNSSLRA